MVDKNGEHYFLEVNPRVQVGVQHAAPQSCANRQSSVSAAAHALLQALLKGSKSCKLDSPTQR